MVVLTVKFQAFPAKQKELLQTLHELTDAMRQEPGFLDARIGIDADNQNLVTFTETWKSQQDADAYVEQSLYFQVLRGAMKVLTSSAEIEFNTNGGPEYVRNHD
jgi:quinol monooxygenase YgiN